MVNTSSVKARLALLAMVLTACDGSGPTAPTAVTQPTAVAQPPPGQTFNITGVVTDERGQPMPGAEQMADRESHVKF